VAERSFIPLFSQVTGLWAGSGVAL